MPYTVVIHDKPIVMKNKYKILVTIIALLSCNQLFAQHGHSGNHNMAGIIRPQPRITGIINANANANSNAKIHANSNSVFGTGNTHPSSQTKKDDDRNTKKGNKDENKKNLKKT